MKTTLLNFGGEQNAEMNDAMSRLGYLRSKVCGSAVLHGSRGRLKRVREWARANKNAHVLIDYESLGRINKTQSPDENAASAYRYAEIVEAINDAMDEETIIGVYDRPLVRDNGGPQKLAQGIEDKEVRDWLRPIGDAWQLVRAYHMTAISCYLDYSPDSPAMRGVDPVKHYYNFGRGMVLGARRARKPVCAVIHSRFIDSGKAANIEIANALSSGIRSAGCLYVACWYSDQAPMTDEDRAFYRVVAEAF
jgi:hypothetical protein